MRWRFWRADDDLSYLPRADNNKADLADEQATRMLRAVQRDGAEVSRLALRLRTLREQNHFAESIKTALSERASE
jgi:hypothetical protein